MEIWIVDTHISNLMIDIVSHSTQNISNFTTQNDAGIAIFYALHK